MGKIGRIKAGVILGAIAGIIDVIPMVLQKLTWDANLSAFALWAIAGFMIATSNLKLGGVAKGIIIAFLLLLPSAIIIGFREPASLIPIVVMTLILGGLLGCFVDKIGGK